MTVTAKTLDTLPAAEAMAAIEELERRSGPHSPGDMMLVDVRELRPLLRLAQAAIAAGPVVEACVAWQTDTGTCHFCGYKDVPGLEPHLHDYDCPLVTAGFIDRDGSRLEKE